MQPQYRLVLFYGFALFAMFFGSGNLVFPLQIGSASNGYWFSGFLGLLFTGILLPFLGLFVIKLHKGNYNSFFGEAGNIAGIVLPFFTLSLLGSFGVVPRCITVAYGGMSYALPELPLFVFSAIFCIATFLCCLKEHVMLKLLGKWMSPILLILLLMLIIAGIMHNYESSVADVVSNANENSIYNGFQINKNTFFNGFLTGYQTMDLFAAFFFSALIFQQVQNFMQVKKTEREILIFAIKSSVVASILLAIIYLGFVFLGAHYSHIIKNLAAENMLPAIAQNIMGDTAIWFVAIAMIFSCFTTAIALNNIYAKYLCATLKLTDKQFPLILFITTLISFVISLLDFKGIAAFLAPILEISYPGLIALTCMIIVKKNAYHRTKVFIFWAITVLMIIEKTFNLFAI